MGPKPDCPTRTVSYTDFNGTVNIGFLQLSACLSKVKSCNSFPFLKAEFLKSAGTLFCSGPAFSEPDIFKKSQCP